MEAHMRTLVLFGLSLLTVLHTNAQIPKQLSYQGVLTDTLGNPRSDGTYLMVFRLYPGEIGGSALWNEVKNVAVKDGIFTTYLGDTTPFPISLTFTSTYWLSVQVGADPELAPRMKLASSPYSLNPGGNSVWQVDSTSGFVYYGGQNVFIGRNFRVSGNEVFGVRYVGSANQYGGMYMETANDSGWPFYGYATNGSFRAWSYYNGADGDWRLYNAGIRLTVPNEGGLRIGPSSTFSLEIENSTGSDGIRINDTGDDGIQIGSSPNYPNYGVYVPSPGVSTYGLWPNTANTVGEWALYTVDNIEAGNVLASAYSLVAKVTGPDALTEGDVVAAAGITDAIPGSQPSLSLVRLADDKQFTGIVGVVQRRMVWGVAPGKEEEGEMSMHSVDGPAQPGDYVSLAILGVAEVKVDPATSIEVGQRLTASSLSGRARSLKSREIDGMVVTEGAQVIGIALAPSRGSSTIPVHISLR